MTHLRNTSPASGAEDLENVHADVEPLLAESSRSPTKESWTYRPDRSGFFLIARSRLSEMLSSSMQARRRRYEPIELDDDEDTSTPSRSMPDKGARGHGLARNSRLCLKVVFFILACCGLVPMILIFLGACFGPHTADSFVRDWIKSHRGTGRAILYPADLTKHVHPIPCHSHNDYVRRVPLFEALHYGLTSVEADVWLFDDDLLIGHDIFSLKPNDTFRNMYVEPIADILDHRNSGSQASRPTPSGVFEADPDQSLVLLVDFKSDGRETLPIMQRHLEALRSRGYLTHFNGSSVVPGAVTVVATGNAPFDDLTKNTTYRDVFFDAPLDLIWEDSKGKGRSAQSRTQEEYKKRDQGHNGLSDIIDASEFNPSNSYYASVPFSTITGWPVLGKLKEEQVHIIREQIAAAHAQGLKVRYWDTPSWPTGLRNHVWKALYQEGVDMLNVDDLSAAAKGDWRNKEKHSWWWPW